jgi:hypothetical protein
VNKSIRELQKYQQNILQSITASDEDADKYRAAYPDWVREAETFKRVHGHYRAPIDANGNVCYGPVAGCAACERTKSTKSQIAA